MGKAKSKTTNTYGWQTPPTTADTSAMRTAAQTPVDYSTPIRSAYGVRQKNADRMYKDLLGGYSTPSQRTAMRKEDSDTFSQQMGLDLANAAQQNSADQFSRAAAMQSVTAPHLVQTGGTSTQSQSPFAMAMQIGQMGASLGSAALG